MFEKYHGCGNDFIITEYTENTDYSSLAKKICNRYVGIGADTFIAINTKDLYAQFYNADGTRAPMCGNGIRCVAAYLENHGYVQKDTFAINTDSGVREVYKANNEYMINMGKPDYDKEHLSLAIDEPEMFNYQHVYNGKEYNLNAVFMTTHHLVIVVDDLNITEEMGNYFCTNPLFKKMINVNFVKIINNHELQLKTYERGVGFTKACGSGTTSAVCVLSRKGLVDDTVKVNYEYGSLTIKKVNDEYYMQGPAKKIAKIVEFM